MEVKKLFCTSVIVMLLVCAMRGQNMSMPRERVPFAAMPPVEDVAAATATNFGGSFVFTFTISVKSSLPTTDVILCSAEILTSDGATTTIPIGRSIVETASVIGTRSSATAATCKLTLFYNWALTTPTTDIVNLQYTVTAGPPAATTTAPAMQRLSSQGVGSIKVPSNGAVTSEAIAVTL